MKPIILLTFSLLIIMNFNGNGENFKIPDWNFYPGWNKSEPVKIFEGDNLFAHINGGSELFHEFGFVKLLVQYYQNGESEISLELYEMTEPEAALGIYLMKCGKETPVTEITARNSSNATQFTIVKGKIFLQINNFLGKQDNVKAMIALANRILETVSEGDPVTLFSFLPEENEIPGTQKLIRGPYALQPVYTLGEGDILNLGGWIFGVLAEYLDGTGHRYTRIIIPYPYSDMAEIAFDKVKGNLDSYLTIVKQDKNSFSFKDYKDEYGTVRLEKARIEILVKLKDLN